MFTLRYLLSLFLFVNVTKIQSAEFHDVAHIVAPYLSSLDFRATSKRVRKNCFIERVSTVIDLSVDPVTKELQSSRTQIVMKLLVENLLKTDIKLVNVNEKGFYIFTSMLRNNSTLDTLNFDRSLCDKLVQRLTNCLRTNYTVKTLSLTSNMIGNMHNDDLTAQNVSCSSHYDIAGMLLTNTSLTALDLGSNGFGNFIENTGSTVLCNSINTHTTLTYLGMDSNSIGFETTQQLAHMLKKNKSLRVLDLSENDINGNGAQLLANSLKKNSTLFALYLYANHIKCPGAEAFGTSLQENKFLSILVLRGAKIGDKGAKEIAHALTSNKTLTALDLGGNVIGNNGAADIAQSLWRNKALRYLVLAENIKITGSGADAIAIALKNNQTLVFLDVKDMGLLKHEEDKIVEAARINNKVTYLDNNHINELLQSLDMYDYTTPDTQQRIHDLQTDSILDSFSPQRDCFFNEDSFQKLLKKLIDTKKRIILLGASS